jgi:hypothetical protein
MLAEDAVVADGAVTFVRQFSVVAYAKFDAVSMRAAHTGAKHTVMLLEARHHAVVEIGFAPSKGLRVRQRLDLGEGNDV